MKNFRALPTLEETITKDEFSSRLLRLGITRYRFAKLHKVTTQTVYRWSWGQNRIPLEAVEYLCKLEQMDTIALTRLVSESSLAPLLKHKKAA